MTGQFVFEERDASSVQQATLCFLIKKDKILLAMKKRGFGKDKWNGLGGKVDDGEKIEEAVVRESKEEVGIKPVKFKKVAVLHFYFPAIPKEEGWDQDVHVHFCDDWEDEPFESDEMRPEWFSIKSIPYDEMWDDDELWLPRVLKGEKIEAWFAFDMDNEKTIAHKIETMK